jgi:hypothetical protein
VVRDDIPGRKGSAEDFRNLTATLPFRHPLQAKECNTMKALLTPGRFSTVPQGLLRPFHLDFSEIMAKIILFNILKVQFFASDQGGGQPCPYMNLNADAVR